jgi:hypothetical protein
MGLAQDEHVVETLSSQRADQPLDVRVRFRRADRRADDPRADTTHDGVEDASELAVVVADQELRSMTELGQLSHLLREPIVRRQ